MIFINYLLIIFNYFINLLIKNQLTWYL